MLDHVYGRPSQTWKRVEAILLTLASLHVIKRYHGRDPPSKWMSKLNTTLKASAAQPWQIILATLTTGYLASKFSLLAFMTAPEPYAKYYSRNYYRATWILAALDAGFFTAINIKPKLLRDIASIVFTIYYLVFADQADNKVRRLRATPTVELMRMSWEKQKHPLFRAISRAGLPRLTYMYRQILVPRHPSSYGYNVADPRTQHISCYLFYKGAASTYPHASQLLLQYPGGGFVCMDPACHEDYLTLWANMSPGTVVLSVDYGKAPEYPYPYAIEECFELYRLLRETNGACIGLEGWDKVIETEEYKNGATEPISPRRVKRKSPIKITIVGDSAGGNIAASVTVRIVESRQTIMMPDALILIYPILAFDMACWMPPQHIHLLRVESVKQVNELVSLKSLSAANNAQTSASPPQSPNLLSNGLARRSKSAMHMSTSHGESDDEHHGSGRHRLRRKKSFYEMASGALQSLRTQKPHTVFDEYGGSGLAHTYTPTSPYPGGGSRDTHAALTSDSLNLDVSEDDSPTDTEDIRKQTDVYHQENVYGLEPRNHALANAVPPSTGTVNSSLAMTSRMSYFNDRVLTPEVMRALAVVYLGPSPVQPNVHDNYHLSPILAPDAILAHFPKVYIMCGEKDPLVDDTIIFAGRLREAKQHYWRSQGYPADSIPQPKDTDIVEVTILEGVSHGVFQMLPFLPEATNAVNIVHGWFTKAFEDHEDIVQDNYRNHQGVKPTAGTQQAPLPAKKASAREQPATAGAAVPSASTQRSAQQQSQTQDAKSKFVLGHEEDDDDDESDHEHTKRRSPSPAPRRTASATSATSTAQDLPRSRNISAHEELLEFRDNAQVDQSVLLARRTMQLSYSLLGEEAKRSKLLFGKDSISSPTESTPAPAALVQPEPNSVPSSAPPPVLLTTQPQPPVDEPEQNKDQSAPLPVKPAEPVKRGGSPKKKKRNSH